MMLTIQLRILVIGMLVLVSAAASAQDRNAGLENDFKDDFIRAIQRNDTTFIFSRVDENIFNGFGGNGGKEEFKMMWQQPHGHLEAELVKALRLGTIYVEEEDRAYAPYLWITFPDSLDAFNYVYVLENDTPAHADPDTASAVLDSLSKGWIKVLSRQVSDEYEPFGGPVWFGLESGTGDTLMVESKGLRSPVDYRFWFEKKKGKWYLMGWAPGD